MTKSKSVNDNRFVAGKYLTVFSNWIIAYMQRSVSQLE